MDGIHLGGFEIVKPFVAAENIILRNVGVGEGVSLEVEGKDWGFDSHEEEAVPKVDDVSLVNGVFDGSFGGDIEEDVVMGECGGFSGSMELIYKGDEDDKKNGQDDYLIQKD
uniref:Uncharacterized protein n=1 Tax=Tanacetum cinerariifolium TaxID=118510 RepID=A0A6L2MP69_TANCI|nr:hypothetical protein [Tanacetum cinerariifolium]